MNHFDVTDHRLSHISKRAFLIGAGQLAVLGILSGRLAWLQLAEGERFKTLSDRNRISQKLIAPIRGLVFDRNGMILAANEQDFRIHIIPEEAGDLEKVIRHLGGLVELRPNEVENTLKRASKQASFLPVELRGNLDWDEVSMLEMNLPDLPGVAVYEGQRRVYPQKDSTAHILGYVGAVNEKELANSRSLARVLSLPDIRIGKTGLEHSFEGALRGQAGQQDVEVNVSGRVVRELSRDDGAAGANLVLTIDQRLQDRLQKRLDQERSAAAVVMDVHSGAVYAMASGPAFDPNLFVRGISTKDWNELLENIGKPLNNKAISGQYPPASTFKMIVALAALEAGVVTKNTSVYCPGHYDVNQHRIYCWKRAGHGDVDLAKSLIESCDVYYYELARELGIEAIAKKAREFGLGEGYDFELPGERDGLIPDKAWKKKVVGDKWRPGDTINASIGQGHVLATPLQLAVMTSRMVNGGRAVKPWMVAGINGRSVIPNASTFTRMKTNPSHIALVKRAMDRVVNDEDGTANKSRLQAQDWKMGGKTGTAQTRRITKEERQSGVLDQKDLVWKRRDHALFVGYAPIDNPRYAVSVIVEHGDSGSGTAAPLAKDIMDAVYALNPSAQAVTMNPDPAQSMSKSRDWIRDFMRDKQVGPQLPQQEGNQ